MARKPELRLNIFGGNLGGPVVIPHLYNQARQKTFFFYNQEFRRIIQGSSPSPVNAIPVADYITSARNLTYQIPKFAPAAQHSIYVPTVTNAALQHCTYGQTASPRQPFPNNTIPREPYGPQRSGLPRHRRSAPGHHRQRRLPEEPFPPSPTTTRNSSASTTPSTSSGTSSATTIHDVTYQAYPTAPVGSDSYPTHR